MKKTDIYICDIGAATINDDPLYDKLFSSSGKNVFLTLIDGDARQNDAIKKKYPNSTILPYFVYNGDPAVVYLTSAESGMSSLKKPFVNNLRFFNGFENFASVFKTENIETVQLSEIKEISQINFLKLDCQASELTILQCSGDKLKNCIFIQTEISFIPLYEDQPTFADIDNWMRDNGFVPHTFLEIKKWSIAPTIKNGDFRLPFNQILEGDIVYVKDPTKLDGYTENDLIKGAILSNDLFGSIDLAIFYLLELVKRGLLEKVVVEKYLKTQRLEF
jgi:hypothetical protein